MLDARGLRMQSTSVRQADSGSSADVGSSSISTSGFSATAIAMTTRCACPPCRRC